MWSLFRGKVITDIVKYHAIVKRQTNRTDELTKKLLLVFEKNLYAAVARDIKIISSTISFHGGASRTAPKRRHLVTNWNLLSPIMRGEIHIENSYPQLHVSFWIGFSKWIFLTTILFILGIAILLVSVMLVNGESLTSILFAVLLLLIAAFFWIGILPWTLVIFRFHWFVRRCINKVESEIESATSS